MLDRTVIIPLEFICDLEQHDELIILPATLAVFKHQNAHLNIIWISKSDHTHLTTLFEMPGIKDALKLGINFFASAYSVTACTATDPLKCDVDFYQSITDVKRSERTISLILQLESLHPNAVEKNREERRAELVQEWGLKEGFDIIERKPTQRIFSMMSKHFPKVGLYSCANQTMVEELMLNRRTVILPLGLLLNLDHSKTGAAFIALAQKQEKKPDLNKLMRSILEEDDKFKKGLYDDPKIFREKILTILGLDPTKVSEKEFDDAWNKMQGDLSTLPAKLRAFQKQHEHVNIIFISKTNPIHLQRLLDEKVVEQKSEGEAPLVLGDNFFVTCRSPAASQAPEDFTDIALYEQIIRGKKLEGEISFIAQLESRSPFPDVKVRDEYRASLLKIWVGKLGSQFIDRPPGRNVDYIMRENFPKSVQLVFRDPVDGQARDDFFVMFKNPRKTTPEPNANVQERPAPPGGQPPRV